ncbi:MAG: hypothetical protein AAF399_04895 [Bacteroidota bacterium]
MPFSFSTDGEMNLVDEQMDWVQVLTYIAAKRTQTQEFQQLAEKIRSNPQHTFQAELKKLEILYDFTPIREIGEESH